VVAIKTTGNVYSHDAVSELNIKAKNYTDLLTGEKFSKADIITLHDVQNAEFMASRDINNFVHLQEVREDSKAARVGESKVRHNPTAENVMKELEKRSVEKEAAAAIAAAKAAEEEGKIAPGDEDVADLLALEATTEDVDPGKRLTSGKAGSSLTSSSSECWTGNTVRLATAEELREAKWRKMRQVRSNTAIFSAYETG
jgi:peptidyl-prolyl cis-trans isomerase-like protein 2